MKINNHAVVAIYKSRVEAEAGVKELRRSGFDMKQLSMVGRDHHINEHIFTYANGENRMKNPGKKEISWSGIEGWLFDSGLFLVPGADPLFVAGPLIGRIVGALEGVAFAGSLCPRGAGLYGISIPGNTVPRYETALKSGKFVVIAHRSVEEVTRAQDIFGRANPEMLEESQMSFPNEEPDIAGAVVMGVGGFGTLNAGLCSLGIPRDSVLRYETALKSSKFVMIAYGTEEEAIRARDTIIRVNPEILEGHHPRANRQVNLVATSFLDARRETR